MNWITVKDGNDKAREIFHRHYSYRPYVDGRQPKLFVGPGEKMVLLLDTFDALFVWRKFKSLANQPGINCAVFRNESINLSSQLILLAETEARKRWPSEIIAYTYVNDSKINSRNPGFCFKKAGWTKTGRTKVNKLLIFEKRLTFLTHHSPMKKELV